MKALISPNESFTHRWVSSWQQNAVTNDWEPVWSEIADCQRVAQVESTTFEVAPPLNWVDCPDDCVADFWYYKDGSCYVKPEDVSQPE